MARDDSRAAKRHVWQANLDGDIGALIAALTDPDARTWAAGYLGRVGNADAIPPLIRLLAARDFQTRAAAAQALGKLRAAEAVPALVECIDSGPEDVMRAWAIDALGNIGSKDAVPKLIEVLDSPHARLRGVAAVALGKIGDPRAVEPLKAAAARESWRTRRWYRRAVRQIDA
jgi:HEAT repeat protein